MQKISLILFFILFSNMVFSQDYVDKNGRKLEADELLAIASDRQTRGDNKEASRYVNQVATIYWEKKEYEKALNHYKESVKLNESINNTHGVMGIYGNMAMIYADKEDYTTSLEYFEKTLAYKRKGKDKYNLAAVLINTSVVLNNLKKYDKAAVYLEDALNLSKELNDLEQMRSCYGMLAETYEKAGNSDRMLHYFDLYKTFHEKIQKDKEIGYKEETEKAKLHAQLIALDKAKTELELKYHKYELLETKGELVVVDSAHKRLNRDYNMQGRELRQKEELAKLQAAEHQARAEEAEAKRREQETIRNFLVGFTVLILGFALWAYRNSQARKKVNKKLYIQNEQIMLQNNTIEDQKAELEMVLADVNKKNDKITKSITYAERIQKAMLKSGDELANLIPESFIFFKPRDIVSGDFYWTAQKDGKTVIASVDCTGHGVPGAFMSMIGANLLSQIVEKDGEVSPEKILERLHEGVNKALHQEDNKNQDGMDLALVVIDKKGQKMEFAGANNPLIYFQDGKLHELKGDKQGVGGTLRKSQNKAFTKHTIAISKPTSFYIFSDGYQDQFGGPDNRKYSIKRLRDTLKNIYTKNKESQYQTIKESFNGWIGDSEKQIDDVLLIGAKIS